MSRFVLKSIKFLHATQVWTQQWSRVLLFGLNSCLYGNDYKLLRTTRDLIEIDPQPDVIWCNCFTYVGSKSENDTNYISREDFSSNVFLYSSDEKEKGTKFSDKYLGDCEIHYRKDKRGEYKIMVCKKNGDKKTFESLDGFPPDVNILKVLGAVAVTLIGFILAAYCTVFFVSIAANVVVLIATVLSCIISYRITKEWWLHKRKR